MNQENIQIKEIKPFLSGYITKARLLLKHDPVPDDDAVHDIRVLMKKSRAVLKLVGSSLETELYAKDLQDLRRVGQIMSEWRDISVHRKTLKVLKKEYKVIFAKLEVIERITILMKKPDVIVMPDEVMKKGIDEIDDLLSRTGYRVRFHQMQKIDPAALLKQLEITYGIIRNVYLECINRTRPERVHELRKCSKDFLYQLYFFRPLNPAKVKSLEKRVERLTVFLGRYNDLYQLLKTIGYVYPDESNLPELDQIVIKIREKQDRYLSEVWPLAFKCFCPGTELVNLLGLNQPLNNQRSGKYYL
jgi:CHAD domain-containing protein